MKRLLNGVAEEPMPDPEVHPASIAAHSHDPAAPGQLRLRPPSGPRGIDWADIDRKARSLLPQSQTPPDDVERILELGRSFEKLKGLESLIALLAAS